METSAGRYAIYFAPESTSALWRFGSRTIGYDAASGSDSEPLVPPGCEGMDWAAATDDPRRYGFHATLKAPFSLREKVTAAELIDALADFSRRNTGLPEFRLVVAALGSFVALVPEAPNPALQALAFRIVEAFEPFRAPLSPADRARRLQSPLTPLQIALLDRYGYPYVGEAFRFHMTLTGKLAPDRVTQTRDALAAAFKSAVPEQSAALNSLALYHQADRASRFRIVARFPLASA